MATVRLNDSGVRTARELVKSGDVDTSGAWTFSSEESSAILGDPPDWKRYGSVHLGIRTGTSRKTKQGYAYPFSKGGKVFRSALIAARQRSAQQGHSAVFNAAGKVLQAIDGKEAEFSAAHSIAENMDAIGAFAADLVPIPWEDLPQIAIQLLPYTGDETLELRDGRRIKVSDESIRLIAERFNERENPLLLDYEHNTYNPLIESGSLAAGWIIELWPVASDANVAELADKLVRAAADEYGPGVYAIVDFTARAASLIEAREYGFVSPVCVQNEDGEVLELLGAGLTNDPAIDGMMPLAAKSGGADGTMDSARVNASSDAAEAAPTDSSSETTEGDDEMDFEKLSTLVGQKVESEEDFAKLVATMKAKADAAETYSAKVQELEAESLEREAKEAVAQAIADGKLSDAQKEWALGVFKSDRAAWDAYLAATAKGTFSAKDLPPQGRLTDDTKTDDTPSNVDFPEKVHFFGKDIPVNKANLATLDKAIQIANERFNGDLARGIAAVRR